MNNIDNQVLPINTILNGGKYKYTIEKVIGKGSYGITYLARISDAPFGSLPANVKVAIKELYIQNLNTRSGANVMTVCNSDVYESYRSSFICEYNNLSRLNHPGIVSVLESFEENNTVYYSMEYIDGVNLNDYIQTHGNLSEKEAIQNLCQISEAVSCMHLNKILHLDIKPINIMRRKNGSLVLIDFGLSKQYNHEGIQKTGTKIDAGTCGYSPIEQSMHKDRDEFAPTLDIYALGATLYKMLTGSTPPDAVSILNDGFPTESMSKLKINSQIISLTSWAMEPMKKNRPKTVEELIKAAICTIPYASEIRNASQNSDRSAEKTIIPDEYYNDFHIHWNTGDESLKNKIRKILKEMREIGNKERITNTGFKEEPISSNITMTLGEKSWKYIYPIIIGDHTSGYFPPRTISLALKIIQSLSYWTGLPFRLSNEDEIINSFSTDLDYWKNLKTLCYSKQNKLQYKTYGINGCLNDIISYEEWNSFEYEIQLVCDSTRPVYRKYQFEVPFTQEFVDEIVPIGFNLYKTRKGERWNIKSPNNPLPSLLAMDYQTISEIKICQIPGEKTNYLGIVTQEDDLSFYYSFTNGKFLLLEIL